MDPMVKMILGKENLEEPEARLRIGKKASAAGIACNTLLCFGKMAVGFLFGSVAVMTDAVNNLSDAAGSIVSLAGFRLAEMEPDAEHPFGHARYEYIAGLAVSSMVLAIGLIFARESIGRIIEPGDMIFSPVNQIVLIMSILMKLWMASFNRKIGETIKSDTLIAAAVDSKGDVLSTGAVLLASILIPLTGLMWIDGAAGLAVSAFLLWNGFNLIKETLSPLLGESPDPELVGKIEEKVLSYENVLGVHDLMVHDYGPGHCFASLHVEMPAEIDPLVSHDLIDQIEMEFLSTDKIHVVIHYDPIVTSDSRVEELRVYLNERAASLGEGCSIHDLRIVPGQTHTNVLFDLVFPAGFKGDRDQVIRSMAGAVREKDATYIPKIKAEQSFAHA